MARFGKLEFEQPHEPGQRIEETLRPESDVTVWMNRADEQRRMGYYEGALQYYSRALEEDRSLIPCWVGQVQMLVQLGEYPEADLWSRKALEIFPAEGDLHASRAQALCRQHKSRDAYASIDQALSQPGESAYRWMVRGELLLADRQRTDRHCFEKAGRIGTDWLIPTEIALVYRHYGQPSNAMNQCRIAVDREPSAPYPWYVLAKCQRDLGMTAQARRSLDSCLQLKPDYREAEDLLRTVNSGGSLTQWLRGLWSR